MLALFGILNQQWIHFAYAGFLITIIIPEFFLLYWHKFSYVEPKVKIVTVLIPIILVLGCFVSFLYIFFFQYDGKTCRHNSSKELPNFFSYETNQCFTLRGFLDSRFAKDNTCVVFGEGTPSYSSIIGYWNYNATSGKCQ